ncbi:MAG: CRISPR-associated endonuclease Cas3'', partial [Clostridium sp.]|uniref:CRISPR-associated endonuclease Cas3'' n=1 Tax=Clostridium sp. TaxID=1506 RepID=UPI002FC67DA2
MYFENEIVNIGNLINNKYKFYAHIQDERVETLTEHTDLCVKYFNRINGSKNIDVIFSKFKKLNLNNLSEIGKAVYRKLIVNTITFHDIGKINPLFQDIKMNNKLNIKEYSYALNSQHSLISAVIYIDYFIGEIMQLEKNEKTDLVTILFMNAYVISKHHGNLDEFAKFLSKFNDDEDGFLAIDIIRNNYSNIYSNEFKLSKSLTKKICKIIKQNLQKKNREESIYLYTYERLLFSTLVACDFYATSEFMNGVELDEFGDINAIDEFYDIYKNTERYKSIRKYEETYYNEEKNLLEETNINILRTEMFLDAEKNLMNNINNNIFFLEAPTGSGKSNVSINLSFKLLKENNNLKKIFYVYPFNTLIEQNIKNLNKTFGESEE